MADVFICYHRSEGANALVRSIVKELKAMDISYWRDIDSHSDDAFVEKIQIAIENCKLFLFIWDSGANQSKWCKHEAKSAFDAHKVLMPFRVGLKKEDEKRELRFYFNRSNHIYGGPSPETANLTELMKEIAAFFHKPYQENKNPLDEKNLQSNEETPNGGVSRQVVLLALSSVAVILLLISVFPIYFQRVSPVIRFRNDTSITAPELEPKFISSGNGWTVDNDGLLVISENQSNSARPPWFDCKDKIEAVEIADNVTRIEDGLCQDLVNLKEVVIPSSVTYVGVFAFRNCGKLSKVTVYAQNVTLREYAFLDCENLIQIEIKEGATKIPLGCFWGCTNLETVTLPKSVVSIGDYAFNDCPNLTTVEIPSVRTIGRGAFSSSSNLSIVLPADMDKEKLKQDFVFHHNVMKRLGLIEFI